MKQLVWGLAILLAILHYDFWYWDDKSLVAGFLPIGLAYHAGFSVACSLVWTLAAFLAWPSELEEWADTEPAGASSGDPSSSPQA